MDGPRHVRPGAVGEVSLGPVGFLRDLELRLGLPEVDERGSARLPRWVARMRAAVTREAFYARSFEADSLGTGELLLRWRDELVEAGWDGKVLAGGVERLGALARLCDDVEFPLHPLPPGRPDRLARVLTELAVHPQSLYDQVLLVERLDIWSLLWRRVFVALEKNGTTVSQELLVFAPAAPESDLGKLQQMLLEEMGAPPDAPVSGDGSLLMVRGETPTEAAELSAALLADERSDTLVIRCADPQPLESASRRFGLPGHGLTGTSSARPALQVLPLALELAFEPKDPHRVLELLTLPFGPFRGRLGAILAKAIARQPGVSGQEWRRQKGKAREALVASVSRRRVSEGSTEADALAEAEAHAAARLLRVAEWIEEPGIDGDEIDKASLLTVVKRTQDWLRGQLAIEDLRPLYASAVAQSTRFAEAIVNHDVDRLSREDVRQLFDAVARRSERLELATEESGRSPHVDNPATVLAPASTMLVWAFVSGTEERPRPRPWTTSEMAALEAAGVELVSPRKLLAAEGEAWRRTVLFARERLVLVVPGVVNGAAASPHPLWDEISTRLRLDELPEAHAKIVCDVRKVLRGEAPSARVRTQALPPVSLPAAAGAWTLPGALLEADGSVGASATALQALASCPLSWVLEHLAKLRFGSITKVAEGPLLNGNLSHRLVEELFREGAFNEGEPAFAERTRKAIELLVRTEAATLLLPGAVFERSQLTKQVAIAMRELFRYFARAKLRIKAVEAPVVLNASVGSPHGRLDLLLEDDAGNEAILDLKWGQSTYKKQLEGGNAIQLALYSRAVGAQSTPPTSPPAGYYALSAARVLTTDARMKASKSIGGPSLEETWDRFESTRALIVARLEAGEVMVAQPTHPPLLERLGVDEAARARHFEAQPGDEGACKYCAFGPLCGKSWKEFR